MLELVEIRDGNSIINFWVEQPWHLEDCSKVCKVGFSGIIPGGYLGTKSPVLSLFFETKEEGKALIAMNNARVLYNDGEGTEAPVRSQENKIIISKDASIVEPPSLEDKEA
ncbi:hypothetical protein ACFL29_02465, partial [Patescibacteria group bacterium]